MRFALLLSGLPTAAAVVACFICSIVFLVLAMVRLNAARLVGILYLAIGFVAFWVGGSVFLLAIGF